MWKLAQDSRVLVRYTLTKIGYFFPLGEGGGFLVFFINTLTPALFPHIIIMMPFSVLSAVFVIFFFKGKKILGR
jgi:hypothetical protein